MKMRARSEYEINIFSCDNHVRNSISECQPFEYNVILYHDTVIVECTDFNNELIYENVHTVFSISEDIQKKMDNIANTTKQISVLFVGIDSVSRLNFIRSLPSTYRYVEDNHWIPLKGYNKIDDNTFPNLMAILTGFNDTYACDICDPTDIGKLDECPMLWYDYRKLGYITSYAEDECWMNTFNYKKKGFTSPPTDYYFRPYILATEKLNKVMRNGMTYCTGPESAGERIMNLAKEFGDTFKHYPTFGFYWMNSFSHNDLSSASVMDNKTKEFLEDLANRNVLENSVVIFFSDHGVRFGDIRLTKSGWLEERLPFIYFSLPKWFKKKFTREFNNFKNNSYKLTSPYDIYMTLKHILVLSGHNYTITPSDACPTCMSLFEEIDPERSCEDAGIEQHWCTCAAYTSVKLNKRLEFKLTDYVLNEIHNIILSENGSELCAKYAVNNIINASLSQKFSYKNNTYLLLSFETTPKAIFESTVGFYGEISALNFSISGSISRLDRYSVSSNCVKKYKFKKILLLCSLVNISIKRIMLRCCFSKEQENNNLFLLVILTRNNTPIYFLSILSKYSLKWKKR
ncbi:hypothetical protein NQ314_011410 [Rhamnusium bicolor]|uniref:DUF229 domain containing protein n=1 Tax=Rhamnusium bicolor TaxID=1586634 RepID=A0AAV8XIM3_9CUCU|nr:hypothetical protein NQ314_011410 [Rhamnusium bicolor]